MIFLLSLLESHTQPVLFVTDLFPYRSRRAVSPSSFPGYEIIYTPCRNIAKIIVFVIVLHDAACSHAGCRQYVAQVMSYILWYLMHARLGRAAVH